MLEFGVTVTPRRASAGSVPGVVIDEKPGLASIDDAVTTVAVWISAGVTLEPVTMP